MFARFAVIAVCVPVALAAQQAPADCSALNAPMDHATMNHEAHMALQKRCAGAASAVPISPGQAAFGAIAEVVRMLDADSSTDWSKVNIEALRQHLIDMDDVTMRAVVAQRAVTGGVEMTVTGTGRTTDAIRRMAVNHVRMLGEGGPYRTSVAEVAGGVRLTVAMRNGADARGVARLRGLGFAGLMAEGDHHAMHHLAIARGDEHPHGG